jgi:hypothetical protein
MHLYSLVLSLILWYFSIKWRCFHILISNNDWWFLRASFNILLFRMLRTCIIGWLNWCTVVWVAAKNIILSNCNVLRDCKPNVDLSLDYTFGAFYITFTRSWEDIGVLWHYKWLVRKLANRESKIFKVLKAWHFWYGLRI